MLRCKPKRYTYYFWHAVKADVVRPCKSANTKNAAEWFLAFEMVEPWSS